MKSPIFQHRHHVRLAGIIADLPLGEAERDRVAFVFANALRGTNPNYSFDRFLFAATGAPSNGRDR